MIPQAAGGYVYPCSCSSIGTKSIDDEQFLDGSPFGRIPDTCFGTEKGDDFI